MRYKLILIIVLALSIALVSIPRDINPTDQNIKLIDQNVTHIKNTTSENITVINSPVVYSNNTYVSFVDTDYGFYKSRGLNITDNRNLTLHVGDTLIIRSDDSDNYDVVIIGPEDEKFKLRWFGAQKSNTFTSVGEYKYVTNSKKNYILKVNII